MVLFGLVALAESRLPAADERREYAPWSIWASRGIQFIAAAMTAITVVVTLD